MFPVLQGNPLMVRTDRTIKWKLALLVVALFFLKPALGWSQFNPVFPNAPLRQNDSGTRRLDRLPKDALALFAFQRAKDAIANGEVTDGLEALQALLDESRDFFQRENGKLTGSMHRSVEQAIAEHHKDYERLFGAEATQLLEEAMATQDRDRLSELVRRFRMTVAGQKAVKLWGVLNADEGNLETATRVLMTSGDSTLQIRKDNTGIKQAAKLLALTGNASEIQAHLEAIAPQLQFDLKNLNKDLPQPLFDVQGEIEFYHWTNPHGGNSQAGQTSFAPAMFSDAWTQPLIDKYDFFLGDTALEEARFDDAQAMAVAMESRIWSQAKRSAFPAGRALIVGNRVIASGYASIKSFDIDTGEIDGVGVNVDQSFEYLHEFSASPSLMNDSFREKIRKLFFSLRGWRDLNSTSLSTDGKYVYAVSDCQLVGSVAPEYLSRSAQRHELLPQKFNQLHAFELDAGLRNRWSVGTVDENAYLPFEPDQGLARQIFFYGAPLPVQGHLYVIGEERGQILLYEIDRETGAVVWSIGLLNREKDIVRDDARRMAGIMPTFSQGLLICPTGEGVLTAIDPLTRRVVWAHQYEKTRRMVVNRLMFRRGIPNREQTVEHSMETLLGDDRWFDSKVVPAGKYIVHTPPDSDELVCLNGLDGSPVWQEEVFRLRSLYVGGVYNKSLILVGRSEISAVNLDDSSRLWSCPIPRPSGRGVRMGDRFLQPLMTGEIVIVDLRTGRELVRSPMPGHRVVGNLSAAHGRLIAQSGTEVVAFKTIPEIEQLLVEAPKQADIAQADIVAIQGELLLQQGDRAAAIEKFASMDINKVSPRGQSVLVWAKLDGLQHEFEDYQKEVDQIESLLTTDQQRFVFLKAMVSGLKESGDLLGAFKYDLTLFETLSGRAILRDFDDLHQLNDQRWALAELQALFEASDEENRKQFEIEIQDWLTSVESERVVTTFLKTFPMNSLDESSVLDRLQDIKSVRENAGAISTIYEKLSHSKETAIASRSLKGLVRHALELKDGMAAELYLKKLQTLGVAAPGEESSVEKFVSSIRNDPNWSEQLNSFPIWPANVTLSEKTIPFAKSSRSQIPVMGPTSVPLKGWTFFLNPMGSQIDVYDQHGRRQCQLSTGVISTRLPIGATLGRFVEVRGHLALIVLADRFLLVDFQLRKDLPRIVANERLLTEDQNPYGTDTFVGPEQGPQVGFRTFRSPTPLGSLAGNVGPLGKSTLCYGLGTQLIAIDPDHGNVLWKRHDLPLGSEIFSDDEYVLTMAPRTRTLQIYRAIDGKKLGTTEIPPGAIDSILDRKNGDWGRCLPVIDNSEEKFGFSMYDPVHKETLWQFESQPGTVWTTIDGQDLAFVSPNKKLTILQGLTGEELLSKTIPMTADMKSITVQKFENQWIVFPGTGPPLQYEFSYPSLITRTIEETVHGTIVAIDQRDGEISWTQEVADQKMTTQAPTEWPILFFGKSSGRVVDGLILNRLTGDVIVEEQWPFDRSWIHWQATIQPMRILIGYGRKTVTLDCHESLIEAPAEEQKAPSNQSDKSN